MAESVSAFLSSRFCESSPFEFYRALFGSGHLQAVDKRSDGRYSGIAVSVPGTGRGIRRFLLGDALDNLRNAIGSDDFTIIAPISYAGKRRNGASAREVYAICFDLDGLILSNSGEQYGLRNFFTRVEQGYLPLPTYVVSSGTGVHLYYFLTKPLRVFPSVLERLERFRRQMTEMLWRDYITNLWDNIQYESPLQAFRAVGSICKDGVSRVRAFRSGVPLDVEELDRFVDARNRINAPYASKSGHSLAEAKVMWPEWFEDVVVNGNVRDGTYTVNRGLYDWWKRQIGEKFSIGHRYWCIYCLACYALKCGIDEDELIADAVHFAEYFNSLRRPDDEPFTIADAMAAVEAFYLPRKLVTAQKIARLSGIPIEMSKRNGRTMKAHQGYRRAIRDFKASIGECSKGGRPKGSGTKERLIKDYAQEHPEASHSQIARELGVSRATVIKWLKDEGKGHN